MLEIIKFRFQAARQVAMAVPPAETSHSSTAVEPRSRPWIYGGLASGAGVLIILATVLGAQRSTPADQPTEQATEQATEQVSLPVEVAALEPVTTYLVQRIYTGQVTAPRTSNLGFERSGTLIEILADEVQQVAAGAPLARLDVQNLQVQRTQLLAQVDQDQAVLSELERGPRVENIAAAEAAVRDFENQLALQNVQLARRQSLYDRGAISREQLDEFSFGVEALEARLAQAESTLEELLNGTRPEQIAAQRAVVQQLQAAVADLDITIGKSTLIAPFPGIVSIHQVNEGTVVSPGQSVLRLVELNTPEARIGLPVSAVNTLSVGGSHSVQLDDRSVPAQLVTLLPEVDAATRTRTVILALPGLTLMDVAPGQTVRWQLPEIIEIEGQGFWLPTDALTQGLRGLWTCYIVESADPTPAGDTPAFSVSQQSIEILHQDGDRVLVRGTIQPGDQVVISGVHRLVPGQRVTPLAPLDPQEDRASL